MENLVEEIIVIEWEFSVQSKNYSCMCQGGKEMYAIVRSNILTTWCDKLQKSYYQDLCNAKVEGRNPMEEKYEYILERTNPEAYEKRKGNLPERSLEKEWLMNWISESLVLWQEELEKDYPHLIGPKNAIRKNADNQTFTSFETMLWGELATYSVPTLRLYAAYVEHLQKSRNNLNRLILENAVARYGYTSLVDAEHVLERNQH